MQLSDVGLTSNPRVSTLRGGNIGLSRCAAEVVGKTIALIF